ncbi:hypothetical protein MW887_004376 [Aspergillus wentii]|nr:hypothetical protein MW887_004376 [Aspergillus wentii]
MPEGFESLALSCKHMHALCTPFITHHKKLHYHFHDFHYYKTDPVSKGPCFLVPDLPYYTATSAFTLLGLIAVEPAAAHYIQIADFRKDSVCTQCILRELATKPDRDDAIIALLANSPYLREAGLDWKEYWAAIKEDLNEARYSQHAAVFILTLLPNVKKITLPGFWKPVPATDKLLNLVIRNTRHQCLHIDRPSLVQVTKLKGRPFRRVRNTLLPLLDMSWAIPFLALPHVRCFSLRPCVGTGRQRNTQSEYLDSDFNASLERVKMDNASVDAAAIAQFLKSTRRLKQLSYWNTRYTNNAQDWDLCQFITAIEHAVGSHLEELSICTEGLYGAILPGKASLRGFQTVRRLQLPLDVVLCNPALALESNDPDYLNSVLTDIIPASVSQLSLFSDGKGNQYKAIKNLFYDFAAKKCSDTPALEEIHLSCPSDAESQYKEQCDKLAVEAVKVGVALHLRENTYWSCSDLVPVPDDDDEYYEDDH